MDRGSLQTGSGTPGHSDRCSAPPPGLIRLPPVASRAAILFLTVVAINAFAVGARAAGRFGGNQGTREGGQLDERGVQGLALLGRQACEEGFIALAGGFDEFSIERLAAPREREADRLAPCRAIFT